MGRDSLYPPRNPLVEAKRRVLLVQVIPDWLPDRRCSSVHPFTFVLLARFLSFTPSRTTPTGTYVYEQCNSDKGTLSKNQQTSAIAPPQFDSSPRYSTHSGFILSSTFAPYSKMFDFVLSYKGFEWISIYGCISQSIVFSAEILFDRRMEYRLKVEKVNPDLVEKLCRDVRDKRSLSDCRVMSLRTIENSDGLPIYRRTYVFLIEEPVIPGVEHR